MACIPTFCPKCDRNVMAHIHPKDITMPVLGDMTTFSEDIATCLECGTEITPERIVYRNVDRAYAAHTALYGC